MEDDLNYYIEILNNINDQDQNREILISKFQDSIWNDNIANVVEKNRKILRELAYDLDYYERDPKLRKEASNYYGDDRLYDIIKRAIEELKKL